jgi:hypothetical protein
MKKIFTLFAGLLIAAAVMAADHRPMVSLNTSRSFKVVIDGRSYFTDALNLRLDNFYGNRRHTIRVYAIQRGFFVRERLVDAASFILGRQDLMIRVDRMGQIDIRVRRGNSRNWSDRMEHGGRYWNDRDGVRSRDFNFQDKDDRDFNDDRNDHDDRNDRDGRDGRDGRRF